MPYAVGALIGLIGILIGYKAIRPLFRAKRRFDAGVVSEYWLQQKRGDTEDGR
jgi:xanthosine utilization system XapX-like protein